MINEESNQYSSKELGKQVARTKKYEFPWEENSLATEIFRWHWILLKIPFSVSAKVHNNWSHFSCLWKKFISYCDIFTSTIAESTQRKIGGHSTDNSYSDMPVPCERKTFIFFFILQVLLRIPIKWLNHKRTTQVSVLKVGVYSELTKTLNKARGRQIWRFRITKLSTFAHHITAKELQPALIAPSIRP